MELCTHALDAGATEPGVSAILRLTGRLKGERRLVLKAGQVSLLANWGTALLSSQHWWASQRMCGGGSQDTGTHHSTGSTVQHR